MRTSASRPHHHITRAYVQALSQLYLTHTIVIRPHLRISYYCILLSSLSFIFNHTSSDFSDKMFPAFGFGAQIPPDFKVSQPFTISTAALPVPSTCH